MKSKTVRPLRAAIIGAAIAVVPGTSVLASSGGAHIERQPWSFSGFKGQYDKGQLQRGFQIYQGVCSGCHGLQRVNFRNLSQPGGPEFPEDAVKELAKSWLNKIAIENDAGESAVAKKDKDGKPAGFEYVMRDPLPADPILGPDRNEKAARARFGGALPPDLSVIAKARNPEYTGTVFGHPASMLRDIVTGYQEGGADYVYALMTGYRDQPPAYKRDDKGMLHEVPEAEAGKGSNAERCATVTAGENGAPDVCNTMQPGMNYNAVFPGHQIAMGMPLGDGAVTYDKDKDNKPVAPETLDQYARDISAFLSWAADPSLNSRKYIGWHVMLYLLVTTLLLYVGKRRVWSRVH